MSAGWLALYAAAGYLAVAMLAARAFYGDWHKEEVQKRDGITKYGKGEKHWSDEAIAAQAMLFGLFWPIVMTVFGVDWVIMTHPPKAPHEIEAELKAAQVKTQAELAKAQAKVAEMERAAGIGES